MHTLAVSGHGRHTYTYRAFCSLKFSSHPHPQPFVQTTVLVFEGDYTKAFEWQEKSGGKQARKAVNCWGIPVTSKMREGGNDQTGSLKSVNTILQGSRHTFYFCYY